LSLRATKGSVAISIFRSRLLRR